MSFLGSYSVELVTWLGALVVLVAAMGRFNNPRLLIEQSSLDGNNWHRYLKARSDPLTASTGDT